MSVYVDRPLIPFKKVLIQGSFLSPSVFSHFRSFSLPLTFSFSLLLSLSFYLFLSFSQLSLVLSYVFFLYISRSLLLSPLFGFGLFFLLFWSLPICSFLSYLPSALLSFLLSLALSLLLYLSLMSLSFLTQTHKSTKADSKCIHLSGFNILPVKASEPYPVRADRPLFPSFPLPYSPVSPRLAILGYRRIWNKKKDRRLWYKKKEPRQKQKKPQSNDQEQKPQSKDQERESSIATSEKPIEESNKHQNQASIQEAFIIQPRRFQAAASMVLWTQLAIGAD